eukprot:1140797-Pelagomonas_calceolata.AAC.1
MLLVIRLGFICWTDALNWRGTAASLLQGLEPQLCCRKDKYHCPTNSTNLQHTIGTADSRHDTLAVPLTNKGSFLVALMHFSRSNEKSAKDQFPVSIEK